MNRNGCTARPSLTTPFVPRRSPQGARCASISLRQFSYVNAHVDFCLLLGFSRKDQRMTRVRRRRALRLTGCTCVSVDAGATCLVNVLPRQTPRAFAVECLRRPKIPSDSLFKT